MSERFSHFDASGKARMVDIGSKGLSSRRAVAVGRVRIAPATVGMLRSGAVPKGDPFEVARIAGIQAAKRTAELIPLCHNLNLDFVDVQIGLTDQGFEVRSEVACRWATGVEMEALTAVTVAALTLYDMCKAVDKAIVIEDVHLESKVKTPSASATGPRPD